MTIQTVTAPRRRMLNWLWFSASVVLVIYFFVNGTVYYWPRHHIANERTIWATDSPIKPTNERKSRHPVKYYQIYVMAHKIIPCLSIIFILHALLYYYNVVEWWVALYETICWNIFRTVPCQLTYVVGLAGLFIMHIVLLNNYKGVVAPVGPVILLCYVSHSFLSFLPKCWW